MKYQTELVLLFFVLSCSVLASSVHVAGAVKDTGGSAVAQQQDKAEIPEKNKHLAREAMAISAQMQDLEKQLEAASKAHDLSKIKELLPKYQKLQDQLNATISQIQVVNATEGHLQPSELSSIPKISAGSGTVFRMSGIHFGCDWNMDWASGSGHAYTGIPWMYLLVNTSPTISGGIWPNCVTEKYTGYAIVKVTDTGTGKSAETEGKTNSGSTILDYVNQWVNVQHDLSVFMPGHTYFVSINFIYENADPLIATGSFMA